MKRIISILLTAAMLALFFAAPVSAWQIPWTNVYYSNNVHTEGINNNSEHQAEMLKKLGLFLGTDKGFELQRSMTRSEAAVMLVRYLGGEAEALAGSWSHPFTDVPAWADKYIGWLYENKLTKGVSATKYGAQSNVTCEQYAIFLSRALTGEDDWQGFGVATAEEVKLCADNGFFHRETAVGLSVRALTLIYNQNNKAMTMAAYMVEQGMFTAEEFWEAAWNVLPPDWQLDEDGHLYGYVAGVFVDLGAEAGARAYSGITTGTVTAELEHFYAWRQAEGSIEYYQVDCRTVESTLIHSFTATDAPDWRFLYVGSQEGTEYHFAFSQTEGKMELGAVKEGQWTSKLTGLELYSYVEGYENPMPEKNRNYFLADNGILVLESDQYHYVTNEGVDTQPVIPGSNVLAFDGKVFVSQLVTAETTTIACLDAATGKTLDTYTVEQDMAWHEYEKDYRRTLTGLFDSRKYAGDEQFILHGEAGMYILADGRLQQLTARPVLDYMHGHWTDPNYLLLTHEPGKRVYGGWEPGGDQIIYLDLEDGSETLRLGTDPAHGLDIDGFIPTMEGRCLFYTKSGVGMGNFDVYTYLLLSKGPDPRPWILVMDFEAGYPELMEGWDYENPEAYKAAYIQKEQERLNGLGYGGPEE